MKNQIEDNTVFERKNNHLVVFFSRAGDISLNKLRMNK
jgi:hypothetical protein